MNYERKWTDSRNAVGFAAECARLALPFYSGDRRSDLVVAIEIAERYTSGEQIDDSTRIAALAAARGVASGVDDASAACAAAARAAAYAAARATAHYTSDAIRATAVFAADYADDAGVDYSEIQIAFARWVVRDLSVDRDLDEELRQAAGAAVVAGDEALARELLG
ncbi:hypothetical protein LCGC14_0761350 [marine sediment metagenome]|uniref:Uncharacterized protein n=1 Tax=marine sediment metagenome TaxID=412755 RepID=A0A0F9Q550_9ZZZZ